ncbi:MAG TPA: transglutaminase-like domain-containing protein [Pirellulaceae bacterium]|nr:transglutaminase-like domain-containing protein [Pirellulaceae bacterium]
MNRDFASPARPFAASLLVARRRFLGVGLAAAAGLSLAKTAFGLAEAANVREQKSRWKFGFEISGQGGAVRGGVVTFPTPMDWPDQVVELVEEDRSPAVRGFKEETLAGGVRQVTASIPAMSGGDTVKLVLTYEVTHRFVRYGRNDDQWYLPTGEDLDPYLGPSPMIETDDREIRKVAEDLTDLDLSAWQQVEKTYDWVQANVEYKFDPNLKGAKEALKSKVGDCEELTSLFIAICRNQGVPARSVWVPGHCYPEFCLEDAQGESRWIPCQSAGARQFGTIDDARPILQRGDSFLPPGAKKPIRYVAGSYSATDAPVPPRIAFLTETVG